MEPGLSEMDSSLCKKEIDRLLFKSVIREVDFDKDQYLSTYFLVDKSSGDKRFILNLKSLNKHLLTQHFKMEDLKVASYLLSPKCFMATIDLEDAYFLVPIHSSHRKFLRFSFRGILYEFQVLPFGLATAPFIFTKIMKPVVSYLREKNFLSIVYLDDFLLLGNSLTECLDNVDSTIYNNVGFIINLKKSKLEPSQEQKFLGFILDSDNMVISLPEDKRLALLQKLNYLSTQKACKIRDFASLIGSLVSICRAVPYGFLYTRSFERQKFLACRDSENDYNAKMPLPLSLKEDFLWWLRTLSRPKVSKTLLPFTPACEIFTDASLSGWGASKNGNRTHGWWSEDEKAEHINFLELKAVEYGLRCFANDLHSQDILLRIDNTTAIAYINKMGSIQIPKLADLVKSIWQWAEERNLYLFASYISSSDNTVADSESRVISPETEWELSHAAFEKVTSIFGTFEVDLFATNINSKCKIYISWYPDPFASSIDAFTISWNQFYFYAFPPFAIISKVLRKIITDEAEGVLIVPWWPTQPWFPLFKSLCISEILHFDPEPDLLSCPFSAKHPCWNNIPLAAGILSGRQSNAREHLQ